MDELSTPSVADFASAFGIEYNEEPSSEPAAAPAEAPVETTESAPETPAQEPAQEEQPQEQPQEQPAAQPKPAPQQRQQQTANAAFAKMRSENANMARSIRATAQTLGLNPNLPLDQLSAEIQTRANAAIAKQNNMDPQILNRLNELEEINNRYQQEHLEKSLFESARNIQSKYNATEDDVAAFITAIADEGLDPSAPGFNLETLFIQRNFQKIVENAVNSAVAAEQARAAKASGASKPSVKQGKEDNTEPHEINSMQEFEDLLNNAVK